ncbi:MAG TPA: NADH-quinone oxidoreductase subunit L [Flavitalea sp.]|nr:NADH-quinone oxidoreductase subunit L [Flavitalea sp.]
MNYLIYLVPLLPLAGFLLNGLFRNQFSKTVTSVIGCGVLLVAFLISVYLFLQVANHNLSSTPVVLFDFISVGKLSIPFAFQVDQLSSLFLLIITGVGFLIHLYSTAYMHEETPADFARYFAYLNLFVFSMLLLVLGANYVILFIGWEGVGLCSYLLIGYWFKNQDYNRAAKKAFVMNRIGDLGFLLAIFWMVGQFGSVNFTDVFNKAPAASAAAITGITLLLFVGATGKSAQIPLYTWLPDAMAGPTPVSALIHAATMVTAGIYMIARSNVLYTLAPVTQTVVAITGLATAVLAATIALRQQDIKKVLAYSTVSQLGYMFLGLGVGAYTGAVFHVMTHAFFKALLFLGAGSVIHALHHEQDLRNMGGLKKYLPVTHATFLIGCIAIAGIPPFAGFFSKDEILAASFANNKIYWFIGVLTAGVTAFYMFRLYASVFLGKFRGTEEKKQHVHESPVAITIPLIVLAILSIVGGWVGVPAIFMEGGHALGNFLAPVFAKSNEIAAEHQLSHQTEWILVIASTVVALAGSILAWNRYSRTLDGEPKNPLAKLVANKWYVDEIYNTIIIRPLNLFSKWLNDFFERQIIDSIVNGAGKLVQYSGRQVRWIQSGQVGSYVLLMVLSILVFFVVQLFVK